MKLALQPTSDPSSYKVLRPYLDTKGDSYEIPDKNNLQKVVVGIMSIPEASKMFNGIEPSISFKRKSWGVGLYLDNEYICSNPSYEELDKYIKDCIGKRMEEMKQYKTLRGIKDRSMIDDIIKLFC